MSLTVTDLFCGAGGSSTGLVGAGMDLVLAANHSPVAIDTHAANHRDADHLCADIDQYDMRRLPKTNLLWASPICTELSPAGGRRRARTSPGQLPLDDDGPVHSGLYERTRATFWDVLRAAEVHRYQAVLVENVTEAGDWELFDVWLSGLHTLGYRTRVISLSSAHVHGNGAPAAPQWRDRIYVVATRTDAPAPDLEPRPWAWCPGCETDVQAVQSWKKQVPEARRIGKYRQQYVYRCPNGARCRHQIVEPYVRPAADVIDWSNPGVRIGDRHLHGLRPLVPNTVKRIRAGLDQLGQRRMVLTVNHGGHDGRPVPADEAPLGARTARIGDAVVIPPHAQDAFVVTQRRNGTAQPVTVPLTAVSGQGRHHWLVVPYRKAAAKTTGEPLHTLGTVDSACLVGPAPELEDCMYRMIQPREQLSAQAFPADYIVHGNRSEQTLQAGNAVSVNVAHWLGERVTDALSRTSALAA